MSQKEKEQLFAGIFSEDNLRQFHAIQCKEYCFEEEIYASKQLSQSDRWMILDQNGMQLMRKRWIDAENLCIELEKLYPKFQFVFHLSFDHWETTSQVEIQIHAFRTSSKQDRYLLQMHALLIANSSYIPEYLIDFKNKQVVTFKTRSFK